MSLELGDLVNIAKQNQPPKPTGDYGIPKQGIEKQINSMPNASKLTRTEKNIYSALPGVTSWMENNKIMGSTYSEQLQKFNNGWLGKGLQYLDVLAEGLERTGGLVVQMTQPGFDFKNLKAAWYAGSLTYDTINLPRPVYGNKRRVPDPTAPGGWRIEEVGEGMGTNVVGLSIPSDLPGAQNGLNDARDRIVQLMQQGVDPKEALATARDEYYQGLGALSLRAQISDFWGHVLADPMNWLTGALKPIEALQAGRFSALSTKIVGGAEDVLGTATDLARQAENAQDVLQGVKYAEDAYKLAQLAGDSRKAAEYGNLLTDLAKKAGKAEDYLKYTDEITDLSRISNNAEEAAKYSESALQALGRKKLNAYDKFAIFMTGGDPLRPSKAFETAKKIPIVGLVFKGFELTPESKARELINLISDNIGSNVISRLIDSPTAEADFVNLIHRMKSGAVGAEYGHAMLTMEGRTVQGFLSGMDSQLYDLYKTYESSAQYRQTLELLSSTLGESAEKILRRAGENPSVLFKQIMEKAPTDLLLAQQIQAGLITPDSLKALAKIFPEGRPYNKEMFFAQAMDAIETAAMRQAVVQFGVKEKGVITRWSDAMKAAESLAFLKINPAYPIRNAVNNEITLAARGLFGYMNNAEIDDFWKAFGFTPKRLLEEGLAQEVGKAVKGSANQALEEALRGGHYTTPDKLKEFFKKISLGKLDATEWGGKLEQWASRRATTTGAMQYLRRYWKPQTLDKYMSPEALDNIANLAPDLERSINNAIKTSMASEAKLDAVLGSNLNVNVDNILDDVSEVVGQDVRQILGAEPLEYIHQKLPQAIASGKVDAFKAEMRAVINNHIDDLFNKQVENLVDHLAAQAKVGGPNVWNQKLAEASDMFWAYHVEYANRMPEATKLAREASSAGEYKLARALWQQEAEDARVYYERAFKRVDAYIQGLEKGTKELAEQGATLPFGDVRKTFGQWKKSWEDFFTLKNKSHDEFWAAFEAAPKNAKPSIDDFQAGLNAAFQKQVDTEDRLMQQLDDLLAGMIDDPQIQRSFVNARDTIAELRRTDKQRVMEIYQQTLDMTPEQRQAEWNRFWQERSERLQEIRGLNATASAIQQGDPQAVSMFQGVQGQDIYSLANSYGIPSATAAGARNDRRILSTVNKYLPEGTEKFKSVADIPEDIARQAFEARVLEKSMLSDAAFVKERSRAVRYPDYALSFVKKYAPDKLEELKDLAGSEDRLNKIKKLIKKIQPPQDASVVRKSVSPNYIAQTELEKMIPDPQPIDLALDQMTYGRISPMIDEIANEAKIASKRAPLMLKDLPEDVQKQVLRAIDQAKNDFSAARYDALKFGQWRRDSALLNYNRRTNFDNWMAHIAPFGFWTTNSMFQWAVNSIDRPAMLTNYLRVKKFLATSGLQRDGMASRTKGKIRIELPFAPDWMGEAFIDPLRLALPFDNWISPFENWKRDQQGVDGRTQRTLDQLLAEGKVTQDEYQDAIDNKAGDTWEFARNMTLENDSQDRYDVYDFATALQAPHAPLAWAYNAAFGDEKDIGPFTPMSRITRNAATLLGVEDWNNSKWNLEAKIRRQLGLPAFDRWDDYRIKRAASNMAGDGSLTPDEAKEAIAIAAMVESGKLTAQEAKQQSEAYRLAVARSNQEFTGGGGSFVLGLLGVSVTSVPEGENKLRALQDDFGLAYGKYTEANDSLDEYIIKHPELSRQDAEEQWAMKNPKLYEDSQALRKFFDENPEYETRLGLFDKPEEQIQKFMVDEVWRVYNEMPRVNKEEVREHLGQEFQESFLDSTTRNTDNVPTELMAVWLKMMNVDPKGGLTADQRLLVNLYGKVQFTDPETAWRVETFYNERNKYQDWYDLQSQYYELPKNQRKAFLNQNPQLREYWDFRRAFMTDNPDLVPYLTDDEKAIERAKNQSRTEQAVPTAQELQVQLTPEMNEILTYYFQNGTQLPPVVLNELDYLAQQQGLENGNQLLNIIQGQYP